MQRYRCTVSYDGSQFAGYQIQPNKRTVQGELERALGKLHKGGQVKVYGSGRTDAGVHSIGQTIHFDSSLSIPKEKWQVAINALLPEDLSVTQVEAASRDFHARFDAIGKEYRYYIHLSKTRDPFKRNTMFQYPYELDLNSMKEAAKHLHGKHDFTSFCSAKTEVMDRVREIKEIELTRNDDILVFRFVGNGFLYNMVRILVGTLIEVGSGEIIPTNIPIILEKKDRSAAGKTAPPQGLYLWQVFY